MAARDIRTASQSQVSIFHQVSGEPPVAQAHPRAGGSHHPDGRDEPPGQRVRFGRVTESERWGWGFRLFRPAPPWPSEKLAGEGAWRKRLPHKGLRDRKSTRLNSSHLGISY